MDTKTLLEKLKKGLKRRAFYSVLLVSLFLTLSVYLLSPYFAIGFSNTPSMNAYFFLNEKYTANHPVIEQGKAVVFPAPKGFYLWKKYYNANGLHYPHKLFLAKYVGCKQGEILNTIGRKDFCNGRFLSVIPRYAVLIPKPHLKIKGFPVWHGYKIPEGYFYAVSPDKYGLDSRYFGLVKTSAVLYDTVPIRG